MLRNARRSGRARRAWLSKAPEFNSRSPDWYVAAMLTVFDHALFAILVGFFPIWAVTFGFKRLSRAPAERVARVRLSVYRWAIAIQWILAGLLILLWVRQHRSWAELGLLVRPTYGLLGVLLGLALVFVFLKHQRAQAADDPEALELVRHRLRNLERMMPRTPRELTWFTALAVTAGICEELLYRGFLIWYLSHALGLIQSFALAGVIFGVAHAYQGPRGMLLTGGVGLFLGAVYALSGSLLAPMLIHAIMDWHTGRIAFVAYNRSDEQTADANEEEQATGEGMPEAPEAQTGMRDPDTFA